MNIILPVRGGEIVRIGILGAGNKRLLPEIGSTILIEKYLDLLGLFICTLLVSVSISLEKIHNLQNWLIPLIIVITTCLTLFIFLGPIAWQRIRGLRITPKWLVTLSDQWVSAFTWMRNPRQIFSLLAITAIIWLIMWSTNLLLFWSQGLELGSLAAGLVLVLVYIGLLPALMPGNIGPFYYFAQLALLPFGINHNPALAYAILLHAIVTLPPLIGGGIFMLIQSKQQKL